MANSTSTISTFDLYQQQMLLLYLSGGLTLSRTTHPVNRLQAREAIAEVYGLLGLPMPPLVLCSSPITKVWQVLPEQDWGCFLGDCIEAEQDRLEQAVVSQLTWPMQMALEEDLRQPLVETPYSSQLLEHLKRTSPGQYQRWQQAVKPELWIESLTLVAFALEVLDCDDPTGAWSALSGVAQHCSWFLPYEGVCFVCDRPRNLQLDHQGQLHGEGEPALSFSDGLQLYAHRGLRLPLHYGQHHPRQWQPRWILEEPDPLLRQALIEGIGYGRLVQEWETTILSEWGNHALLELNLQNGTESFRLLKRSCPKTQVMDVLRVPKTLKSAQSAACWVHWNLAVLEV